MMYSDAENQRWWTSLGKSGQNELLQKIKDRASSRVLLQAVEAVEALPAGRPPTQDQLHQTRKWA